MCIHLDRDANRLISVRGKTWTESDAATESSLCPSSWKRICVTAENLASSTHVRIWPLETREREERREREREGGIGQAFGYVNRNDGRAYLASLLKILGDLFTAICDGDLSISLVSAPAFSNTWNRDFTFRLDNSSRPRSGLSEAANGY